ncbi:MAG: peptide ABC transporter substrate-binding protein, partial [Planctomycetota bacterium]
AGLLFDVANAREYLAGEAHEASVGIHAPSDRDFVVRLDRPVPYFPSLTAFFTLLPVPAWAVEAHGDRWTREGKIVTNGPFVLERWAFYREIVLRRSPTYWDRESVGAERIRILPVVDPNTQFNLYETGAVDLVFSVPSSILHRLAGRPDFVHGPRLATAFLRLNVTRPPFDAREARTAVSLAVDREALVSRITRGGELSTGSLVPPGLPGYLPPEGPSFLPDDARAHLARAGHPEGRGFPRLALLYPDNPDYAAIATVLQHQLRKVLGIDVRLDAREWKVYLSSMRRLDYDLAFGQWIGDYPDPSTFLDCFRSASGNNRTGWSVPRYDDMLDEAAAKRAGETPEEHARRRLALLREAESLLVDDGPIVPLYHPTVRYMVSPRARGFAPNMMGLVRFADLRVGGR